MPNDAQTPAARVAAFDAVAALLYSRSTIRCDYRSIASHRREACLKPFPTQLQIQRCC
jgi:hypothetical protein